MAILKFKSCLGIIYEIDIYTMPRSPQILQGQEWELRMFSGRVSSARGQEKTVFFLRSADSIELSEKLYLFGLRYAFLKIFETLDEDKSLPVDIDATKDLLSDRVYDSVNLLQKFPKMCRFKDNHLAPTRCRANVPELSPSDRTESEWCEFDCFKPDDFCCCAHLKPRTIIDKNINHKRRPAWLDGQIPYSCEVRANKNPFSSDDASAEQLPKPCQRCEHNAPILYNSKQYEDTMDIAWDLFKKGYVKPAGTTAGCILEKHLIDLCNRLEVAVDLDKDNIPGLIGKLKTAGVPMPKHWPDRLQSYYRLRTECAHARIKSPDQIFVKHQIQELPNLLSEIDHFMPS